VLKDVGKILHHFVPLSRESLLKQQLIESSAPSFLFSSTMEGFLGMREIFLKRDKLETQLLIQIIFGTK
jgi:hypothetical protein